MTVASSLPSMLHYTMLLLGERDHDKSSSAVQSPASLPAMGFP